MAKRHYQVLTFRSFQLPEAAVKQSILHNLTDLIIPPKLSHHGITRVRRQETEYVLQVQQNSTRECKVESIKCIYKPIDALPWPVSLIHTSPWFVELINALCAFISPVYTSPRFLPSINARSMINA